MSQLNGHISQIIGPVIDVYFDTAGKNAEEVLPKIRQASDFGQVLDAVLDIPNEHIDNKLLKLVNTYPKADVAQLETILTKQYITRTAYASSAVGAGAAIPGAGTGVALGLTAGELATYALQTTTYILAVSRLHGFRPADRENAAP